MVLDVMLPGMDGFEILRRLRAESKVPVIMLTARGEDVDRIIGLELGADDYLPKPFNPRELAARIRAILRRYGSRARRPPRGRLEVNGVAARSRHARGLRRAASAVELTTFEFDILEMLMRSAGRVLSRDALMENFYNRKATPFDRSIDMHISHLRKKLETGDTADQDHSRRGLPVLPHAGGRRSRNEIAVRQDPALVLVHAGDHRGRARRSSRRSASNQTRRRQAPVRPPGAVPAGRGPHRLRERRPARACRPSWRRLQHDLRRAAASSPTTTAATC